MNFRLRNRNSKIVALLVTVLFLFSFFPGYGLAEDNEPDPDQIALSKKATAVRGTTNQWQVTLTITGKDLVQSSNADIVLVIDRSGSMSENSRMDNAKAAATFFINTLLTPGNTSRRIAIVSFATNVTINPGNVSDAFKGADQKQTLLDVINGLSARGGTFTQAGIRQAQELLATSPATNKFIVLLSDGVPTYSYKINNPDNYMEPWGANERTNESIPESEYDYIKTIGDGIHSKTSYKESNYYSHGNSAISQSKFAKAAGQTIYTIALDAGDEGNRVLNGIASPGKAYTGSSLDLNHIFQQIATNITKYAATNVTVTDPVADEFFIPGITADNYKDRITVNQGSIAYNADTETITWNIPFIAENAPATMSYIIEIVKGIPAGQYPTNKTTSMSYTDVNGNPATRDFEVPQVEIKASGHTGTPSESQVTVEPEAPPVPLNKQDHYAYMVGYPDGTFQPEGKITREEVATVFYKLLDAEYRQSVTTNVNNFPDIKTSRWSSTPISTLAAINIIIGYPDGTFKPGDSITRAELATVASKFDKLRPFESNQFSDITGHWANTFINSAAQKGWVRGYEDGTFRPEQAITRAEFATLVNNVLDRRVKKENILPSAIQFQDLSANAWYYEACQEAVNSHYYIRKNSSDFEEWTELYEFSITW